MPYTASSSEVSTQGARSTGDPLRCLIGGGALSLPVSFACNHLVPNICADLVAPRLKSPVTFRGGRKAATFCLQNLGPFAHSHLGVARYSESRIPSGWPESDPASTQRIARSSQLIARDVSMTMKAASIGEPGICKCYISLFLSSRRLDCSMYAKIGGLSKIGLAPMA